MLLKRNWRRVDFLKDLDYYQGVMSCMEKSMNKTVSALVRIMNCLSLPFFYVFIPIEDIPKAKKIVIPEVKENSAEEAIRKDWEQVGAYLYKAIDQYKNEQQTR